MQYMNHINAHTCVHAVHLVLLKYLSIRELSSKSSYFSMKIVSFIEGILDIWERLIT